MWTWIGWLSLGVGLGLLGGCLPSGNFLALPLQVDGEDAHILDLSVDAEGRAVVLSEPRWPRLRAEHLQTLMDDGTHTAFELRPSLSGARLVRGATGKLLLFGEPGGSPSAPTFLCWAERRRCPPLPALPQVFGYTASRVDDAAVDGADRAVVSVSAMGGRDDPPYAALLRLEAEGWTELPMPTMEVGDSLQLLGGQDGALYAVRVGQSSTRVLRFDDEAWNPLVAPLADQQGAVHLLVAADGTLYVFGFERRPDASPTELRGARATPSDTSWTDLPPLVITRNGGYASYRLALLADGAPVVAFESGGSDPTITVARLAAPTEGWEVLRDGIAVEPAPRNIRTLGVAAVPSGAVLVWWTEEPRNGVLGSVTGMSSEEHSMILRVP